MKARARRSDPETSHEAAAKCERSSAGTQREIILAYVLGHPGLTHAEIGEGSGLGASIAHKRLPELRKAGFVSNGETRKCRVRGTKMMTWNGPKAADADGQETLF